MFWCFSQEILFRFFICKNWHVGTRAISEQSSEPSFPLSRKAVFYVYFSPFSIISLTVLTLISTAVGLYWPVLQKMCDVLQLFKVSSYLQNFFSIIFCLNDLFVYILSPKYLLIQLVNVRPLPVGPPVSHSGNRVWKSMQLLRLHECVSKRCCYDFWNFFVVTPFPRVGLSVLFRSFPCGTLRSFPF